jgi:Trk-type K+ transport system membrane component
MIRSGLILRALPWMGKKISLPQEAVVPFKFGGRVFKEAEISIIALFACIYLVILGASALSMTFMGYAPLDSVFMSASAEGTAGLSVVPVDGMNPAGKLLLTSIMLLGRLEIIPFMVLIYVLMSGSLKSLASVKIPRGKGGSESGQAEAKGD